MKDRLNLARTGLTGAPVNERAHIAADTTDWRHWLSKIISVQRRRWQRLLTMLRRAATTLDPWGPRGS